MQVSDEVRIQPTSNDDGSNESVDEKQQGQFNKNDGTFEHYDELVEANGFGD